jgi:hypothetical protein
MKAKATKEYLNESFRYYGDAYRNYATALAYLPDDRFLKEFFVEASHVLAPN